MTKHPIIFSGEMVRAILAGHKTQTRRVIKPQPSRGGKLTVSRDGTWALAAERGDGGEFAFQEIGRCPYGQPGDMLWVRETWAIHSESQAGQGRGYTLQFRADGTTRKLLFDSRLVTLGTPPGALDPWPENAIDKGWRPSIHMPRWASRLVLELTGVRVERVQDISGEDCQAEGIHQVEHEKGRFWESEFRLGWFPTPLAAFRKLWNSINAKRGFGWDKNPLVWVIEFKQVKEEDND